MGKCADWCGTITYTGPLNYRGYRQDELDLIRVAAASGEAFVLLDERQVMFVDEFTAATARGTRRIGR